MKAILVLFLLFVNVNLFGQINLVSDKIWRNKVHAALDIVYKYEPALFNNIIVNSTIQAGDLGVAGYAGFCDVQVTPSGKILWIMIGIEELKNSKMWWNGPDFITRDPSEWPTTAEFKTSDDPETKKNMSEINFKELFLTSAATSLNLKKSMQIDFDIVFKHCQ
jgi:hypothetical protein